MTSSVPKFVLRYVLDKGQYFDLESVFTHSCFPNKETDSRRTVKQFISFDGNDKYATDFTLSFGFCCYFPSQL